MSEYEYGESASEELLSLLNISRENVPNYDELAELAGQCLEEQFWAGANMASREAEAAMRSYRKGLAKRMQVVD